MREREKESKRERVKRKRGERDALTCRHSFRGQRREIGQNIELKHLRKKAIQKYEIHYFGRYPLARLPTESPTHSYRKELVNNLRPLKKY